MRTKIGRRITILSAGILFMALFMLYIFYGITMGKLRRTLDTELGIYGNEEIFEAEQFLYSRQRASLAEFVQDMNEAGYGYTLIIDGDIVANSCPNPVILDMILTLETSDIPNITYLEPFILVGLDVVLDDVSYTAFEIVQLYQMEEEIARHKEVTQQYIYNGLFTVAIIFAVCLILTHLVTRRIMKPVKALISGARRVEKGDFTTPVEYRGDREYEELCGAFNRMQVHLLEEQRKNRAYEKAKTDMVAGISHDLRTPLTSVKGYLKGILDGVADTPDKRNRYLQIAYDKTGVMEKLLKKLFQFASLETGEMPLHLEQVDAGTYMDAYVRDAAGDLSQKGIELEYENRIDGSVLVKVDTEQILRVFDNLVENAVKYAEADPLRLHLSAEVKDGRLAVVFGDNGQGVPEERIPHLFEQFYRMDETVTEGNKAGNGLGLYIVKKLLEMHSGDITARNHDGLEFCITLPILQTKECDGEKA